MCLIPGIADGRFLLSNEVLPEELAVDGAECQCGKTEHGLSRRQLITKAGLATAGVTAGGAMLGSLSRAAAAPPKSTAGSAEGDRVVMLGLNGGPVLSPIRSQPSLCLVVNDSQYLVDCGGDSAQQLVNAGLNFSAVRHIFFTHQHIDHTAGYPEFALLGWLYPAGLGPLKNGVQLWSPPPITQMTHHLREMYKTGTELFETIGFPSFEPIIKPRQLSLPKTGIRKVMEDENVVVHATRVYHGPEVHDAYAYRFDIKASGKAVTFSGDTIPNEQLIALAKGSDLLVHEAQMNSKIPAFLEQAAPSVRPKLKEHLENSHTDVVEIPRIAKAAGVERVSMCHYALDPYPENYLSAAKKSAGPARYKGEIIAPTELDQILI